MITDLEDSTWLWEHHTDVMEDVVLAHAELVRSAAEARGVVVKSTGDGVLCLFADAVDAVDAAVAVQSAAAAARWPDIGAVGVRIGINTGLVRLTDDDVIGPAPNLAARLQSAGHGGQILVSEAAALACGDRLPAGQRLRPLGPHLIRSFDEPVHVHMVEADGLRVSFPPLRIAFSGHEDLPTDDRELFGRDAVVARVGVLLGDQRLVTLWGPGGIGKTRIAIRVATTLRRPFQDGVRFVDLHPATASADVIPAVLAAFRARPASSEQPTETLVRALGTTRVLVVLDNCEHVLPAVREVARLLLDACPGTRLLATSREPLGAPTERAVEIEPLPVPSTTTMSAAALAASPAVQLFAACAIAARPGWSIDDLDAPTLAALCQATDGLPLALELLGARAAIEGIDGHPAEIVRRLAPGVLSDSIGRTLANVGEAAAELFGRLSVFDGAFDRDAVEAAVTSAEPGADLDRLVRTAVVQRDVGGRFRVLGPFRAVGRARLGADRERAARWVHARTMLERAEADAVTLRTGDEATSTARLSADFADHRAAFRFLHGAGALDESARLAIALFMFCLFQPRPEGHHWIRTVAGVCRGDEPWAAEVLGGAALASWFGGDLGQAIRFGDASVAAARTQGSDRWARMALSDAHAYAGDIDAAVPHFMEVVRAATDDEPFWQVHGLGYEAIGLSTFGSHDAAVARAERALSRARALGNPDCTQWAFYALGRALAPNDAVAACEAFESGMRASASVGSRFNVGIDLVEWVGLKRSLGEHALAVAGVLDLLDLVAVSGNRGQMSQTLREAGAVLADVGRAETAALAMLARRGLPAMPHHGAGRDDPDEPLLEDLRRQLPTRWSTLRVRAQAMSEPELLQRCRDELLELQSVATSTHAR